MGEVKEYKYIDTIICKCRRDGKRGVGKRSTQKKVTKTSQNHEWLKCYSKCGKALRNSTMLATRLGYMP